MKNTFYIICCLSLSLPAVAKTLVTGNTTKIKEITSYHESSSSAAGDIRIIVENPSMGCGSGFFLKNDAPGKKDSLDIALSAYHSNPCD